MDFNPDTFYSILSSELHVTAPFLTSDLTIRDAAKWSLRESIFKKLEPRDSSALSHSTVVSFLRSNALCGQFVLPDQSTYVSIALNRAREMLHHIFHSGELQSCPLTLNRCLDFGRAGPGASKCTRATNFYEKMFEGPLSTTSAELYSHYVRNISQSWRQAEYIRLGNHGLNVVESSNLSTVPKNMNTKRTICTEPSLNMFYQLGAGVIIEKLLQKFHNIDLSTQPDINRRMAYLGSIDGSFATIDLKSASDTIAEGLVKYLLPRPAYETLDFIRCRKTSYEGRDHDLKMFSSMGNGFTFPLQTLIFATLVRAAYELAGVTPRAHQDRNYAVFGDDIICTKRTFNIVCQVLVAAGFTVNYQKSFSEGPFRESCGHDYFKGADIRGIYIKKVENASQIYSCFNRLLRWSCRHNVAITRSLLYVEGLVDFRPVPLHAGDSEGIIVPQSQLLSPKFDRNGAVKYTALVPVSRKRRVGVGDSQVNPSGVLIAQVGGYLVGGKFDVRSCTQTYKVVKRKTPSWDFCCHPGLTIQDFQHAWLVINVSKETGHAEVALANKPR